MLVQNILHENDLNFKRMDVQVTCIFILIVLHKDSFCHKGKSQLFIHELAQGAFDCVALCSVDLLGLVVEHGLEADFDAGGG